jgi:hypothetical protein
MLRCRQPAVMTSGMAPMPPTSTAASAASAGTTSGSVWRGTADHQHLHDLDPRVGTWSFRSSLKSEALYLFFSIPATAHIVGIG